MVDNEYKEYMGKRPYGVAIEKVFNDDFVVRHGSADRVYPFSNENIKEYLKELNLNGAKVLTVGSSGDQLLHCIFEGANSVTLFDGNEYARFYVELKIASIKNLSMVDFMNYFTPNNILNHKYYAKISHDLSEECQVFWDTIMLECDDEKKEEIKKKIFRVDSKTDSLRGFNEGQLAHVFYKNEKSFLELKEKLKSAKVFYATDTFDNLNQFAGKKKYDLIMLSNIYDYVDKSLYVDVVSKLYYNNLQENGRMQLNYFFYDSKGVYNFMKIASHYLKGKIDVKCFDHAMTFAWDVDKGARFSDDGNLYRYMRDDMPYQSCAMMVKE